LRLYLEVIEKLSPESDIEPEFVRIDITGWTHADVQELRTLLEDLFPPGQYVHQLHRCHHDEGRPCEVTVLA